ncbi:TPA: IS1 family transposase [Escherichia coli]
MVCAEMDEQWDYAGAKSRQRWLFYVYDRMRRTVVAHVFGERSAVTLERLLSLLSAFDAVVWVMDGAAVFITPEGKAARYQQTLQRSALNNMNLRQHLARLGGGAQSFSKSVELHDKVIRHYLNIKYYQ